MIVADAVDGFIYLAILVGLYFVPTIIAKSRNVPNLGSIAVINVFLGWTLVGWVVALAMAVRTVPPSASASISTPRGATGSAYRESRDPALVKPPTGRESELLPAARESVPTVGADEIERLAALHERGALSDEEFAAAKARLLGL